MSYRCLRAEPRKREGATTIFNHEHIASIIGLEDVGAVNVFRTVESGRPTRYQAVGTSIVRSSLEQVVSDMHAAWQDDAFDPAHDPEAQVEARFEEPPIEFTESPRGYEARYRWAKAYDDLNGAPEGDLDR